MKSDHRDQLNKEFDRQVQNLIQKGYPGIAGIGAEEFLMQITPLKARIRELTSLAEETMEGRIPFVIVVNNDSAAAGQAMQLVERNGKQGFTVMDADDINRFRPIEGLKLSNSTAYLLVDIDTGKDTLNITPDEAMKAIEKRNRSPLTIDEGVSLVTHYPEVLRKDNGFSLLGSRCGDRRVTALWISGGRPKLGWCWAGNPHTWLGSASCGSRVGP